MNDIGWGQPPAEVAVDAPKFEVKYASQPDTIDPETWRLQRNAAIDAWLKAKEDLGVIKTHEMDHRTKVTKTLFPNPAKGTQRYDLGNGYKVKLVYGLTYSLGNKDLIDTDSGEKVTIRDQISKLEDEVAALGDAHRVIFESLVTWRPEISGSQYEKLNASDPIVCKVRDMIAAHLTIKPASPTLEFEQPKAES